MNQGRTISIMHPITQTMVKQIDVNNEDVRTKEIMTSLIRHLHAFVQDVRPTEKEWKTAIDFLTRTGQKCDDKRQEFILLSDVLGVSILVDEINNESEDTTTDTTILGPFYHDNAPTVENGAMITTKEEVSKGNPLVVDCLVHDGNSDIPVTNCTVNVWQASSEGLYDVQKDDSARTQLDLRATLHPTVEKGRFWFTTVQPASYPVPTDGPVGELLTAMGKHPYRPAHLHFRIAAPGFETLTTHLFLESDPYLKSDAVHAVKQSLIVGLAEKQQEIPPELGDQRPVYELKYTFRLKRRRRRGLNDRNLVEG
jgi:protocatechuate 3,4-dioxygenase beta subunit